MSASLLVVLIGWLVALAIFFGFIILLRYLQYREHIAMISTGIHPNSLRVTRRRSRGLLRAGLHENRLGTEAQASGTPFLFFHADPRLRARKAPRGRQIELRLVGTAAPGDDRHRSYGKPLGTENHPGRRR